MNKKDAIEELKKHVEDSIKLYEQSLSYGFAEGSYRHRMFNEIIKAFEDPLTLADIFGWEEGATYKVGGLYYLVVGNNLYYFKDFESLPIKANQDLITDLLGLVNEAEKVETKKYYLRHKFLGCLFGTYLNHKYHTGEFCLSNTEEAAICQTQFTDSEIEEIEASGFDLTNYEKIEVRRD